MNPLRFFRRPEYFLRPTQLWRRLRRNSLIARNALELAWGLPVEVDPQSLSGGDICNLGVYDTIVAEAVWRLVDPGENAIDAGANVGQNTSLMALAAGARGRVFAFEPTVHTWNMLVRNIERWSYYGAAPIAAERKALSAIVGSGILRETIDSGSNTLETQSTGIQTGVTAEVELTTLDTILPADMCVGVMKIDVEGHERAVLEGASRMLAERRIRDIVFEDFFAQPSVVTELLRSHGYTVFSLFHEWRGPRLLSAEAAPYFYSGIAAPNYLGTIDPVRAQQRFQPRGWQCLHLRSRPKSAPGAAR